MIDNQHKQGWIGNLLAQANYAKLICEANDLWLIEPPEKGARIEAFIQFFHMRLARLKFDAHFSGMG